MKFKVDSIVHIKGIGKVKASHTQTFADDSNVFGRVLEYHQYMHKAFPNCDFKLIKATEVKGA